MIAPAFRAEMVAALPRGLAYPRELLDLFDWMEAEGCIYPFAPDIGQGRVYATLFPQDAAELHIDDDTGQEIVTGGTQISFFPNTRAESGQWVTDWLGRADADVLERLHIFCSTGDDGSVGALWRDEAGRTRLVHLGSGSGSVWMGLMGETALDFIRLLAIGYEEICWTEEFDFPAGPGPGPYGVRSRFTLPNVRLRNWVKQHFKTEIPLRGRDIFPITPSMDEAIPPPDDFWRWMQGRNG